jgi:hypothetical protein
VSLLFLSLSLSLSEFSLERVLSNLPLTRIFIINLSLSLSSFRKHVRHRPMRDFRRHENQFEATVCGEQSIVRD